MTYKAGGQSKHNFLPGRALDVAFRLADGTVLWSGVLRPAVARRMMAADDLLYQDEVRGPLLEQLDKGLDLLLTNYLTASIRSQGAGRLEEFLFPKQALREALLNALAHKDYSSGSPVQVSVYEDRLVFWNDGQLPDHWTVENLTRKHPSRPFNPDVANTLFRAGYSEAWGRGTIKMTNECSRRALPVPRYAYEAGGCTVEFFKYIDDGRRGRRAELIPIVLRAQTIGTVTNSAVQELPGVSKSTATRYLNELDRAGYLQK